MIKHGIDQDALIREFSQATARQGDKLRQAVNSATLKALQGRELTLSNIKQVLGTVAKAASTGAAANPLGAADVGTLLEKAFAGMDAALVMAVQANRKALEQVVEQGVSVRETQVKKALSDLEKMEDTLFAAVRKAAATSGEALQAPWARVLDAAQAQPTHTGEVAAAAVEQFLSGAQESLRTTRAAGLQAAQALMDSYATLVSGVLIGMSDALQQSGAGEPATARRKKG